jgi:hypothetical protein
MNNKQLTWDPAVAAGGLRANSGHWLHSCEPEAGFGETAARHRHSAGEHL